MSRKKWGKSATKTEKIIRDAVPKPEVLSGIDEFLGKTRSVTCFDIANRFNIRMSVARNLLREKEAKGELVPYIKEGGFVVYTTPAELEKHDGRVPTMISDAMNEVASSVTAKPVMTEEMDEALHAAGTPGAVKPSKLTRQRRERGDRKERKDDRPEVVVVPLEDSEKPEPEPAVTKKKPAKKDAKPKKEAAKKKPAKKEAKPKKEAAKKKPAKKDAKSKKEAAKKKPAKKDAKPKKEAAKKKPAKKEAKPKKEAAKKKPAKKDAKPKKEAAKKKPAKKTTKKKSE
ncbi:MAG: hypothetical protein ACTSWA_00100 [Candidatus Thorarchaeota archaeon]